MVVPLCTLVRAKEATVHLHLALRSGRRLAPKGAYIVRLAGAGADGEQMVAESESSMP